MNMPAQLAYKMFRSKTEFPLHTAIRAKREDVVFLYLVEHDAQVCSINTHTTRSMSMWGSCHILLVYSD